MERYQLFKQPSFIPVFENYDDFRGCCVGITGHKGVLGTILYKRMLENGVRIETYSSDITDAMSLENWFDRNNFEYFFHFAAVVPVDIVEGDALTAYETNAIGTYNICKQIIKSQRNCWLFLASSSHVYETSDARRPQVLSVGSIKKPGNFYGASKLAAEQIAGPLLKHYNIPNCIGRIFSFSSVLQKEPYLVPTIMRKIKNIPDGGTLEIINPDSVRDIIDAETVIDCVLHLAQNRFRGTINIASGQAMSIADITRHIAKVMKRNIKIRGINKSKPNSLIADVSELKKTFSK